MEKLYVVQTEADGSAHFDKTGLGGGNLKSVKAE